MKKTTFLFFAFLMYTLSWQGMAQIAIGEQSGTTSTLPINGLYDYSYSQQIVYQHEIDAFGEITSISFYFASGINTDRSDNWSIYMGHTSKTGFTSNSDWVPISNLSPVFSGTVTFPAPGNWMTVTFNTPFPYNDSDNLVVAILESKPGFASTSFGKTVDLANSNRGIYTRRDNNVIDPSTPPNAQARYNHINNMILGGIQQQCPRPANLSVSHIGSNDALLHWDHQGANEFNIIVREYDGNQFDPQGAPYTHAGVGSSPYTTTGLSPSTTYEFYVVADCDMYWSQWAGPFAFTTTCASVSNFSEDFEATTGSIFPNCWAKVGTTGSAYPQTNNGISGSRNLYMASGATVSMPPVNNAAFNTHQMSMKVRGSSSTGGTIQFGYLNPNDGNNFVLLSSIVTNSTSIPQEFTTEVTGMLSGDVVFALRVAGSASIIDNINWEPLPSCPVPTNITVSDITANSAQVSWTDQGIDSAWEYIWGPTGLDPDTYTTYSIPSNYGHSMSFVELSPNTTYDLYLTAICGVNDASNRVGPISFTTLCDPGTIPFTEDFESGNIHNTPLGNCWTQQDLTGGGKWTVNNTFSDYGRSPRSGDYNIFLSYGNTDWIFYPLTLTENTTYELTFYARQDSANGANASIEAAYGLADNASAMINSIIPSTPLINGDYQEVSGYFRPTTSGVYYIGIKGTINSSPWYISLDDISVNLGPTCLPPNDIIVSDITANSVQVSWTDQGIDSAWEYIWGPTGLDPDTYTTYSIPSNYGHSMSIVELSPNTTYDLYLTAICGVNDASNRVGPISFTTLCGSISLPWNEGFESGTTYTDIVPNLSCWSQEIVSGNTNWKFVSANGNNTVLPHSGSLMAEFRNTNSGTASKLVTPAMDLTSITNAQLTFYLASAKWFNDVDELRVYYKKSSSDTSWTLIDGAVYTTERPSWEMVELLLPEANGATDYLIAFEATSNYARGLNLDDVSITGEPAAIEYRYENNAWTPHDPSGVATNLDNIIVVNGTAALTANTDINHILISYDSTLEIHNVLNLYGNVSIDGDLVFVSNANGNGELGYVSDTAIITGEATVQSYMSHNRSYRMVSSSVTTSGSIHDNWQEGAASNIDNPNPGFGTHITGSRTDQHNGFDGTATGNPSMFFVPWGSQQFQAIANTNQTTLNAGDPYLLFVRGDRSIDLTDVTNLAAGETTLRAKGTLHTGPTQQDFETADAGLFVMFGNPYQSAVDINSVLENNFWFNTNFYHVYDPNLATHGGYVTVNLPDGTNTNGSDANQYLQPGQGGQFVVTVPGAALISVFFDESDKAPGNFTTTSATGNRLSAEHMLTVQLFTTENFNNGGPTHDSFGIIFGDGHNNEVTHADALKPMNFYENLGRDHNGTYLSIERREMPADAEVYQLYSSGYNYTDYTLKMKIDGLDDINFYLDDHFTGTSTLLEGGETVYTFAVDSTDPLSIATDRFSIRTEARLSVDSNSLLAGVRLFPNPLNDSTIYINAPKLDGETVNITVNDLLGREIANTQQTFSGSTIKIDLSNNLKSGVYMVTISTNGTDKTLRVIKR